jgi:pimeloyl-ACP methyl ester carboxylesterase
MSTTATATAIRPFHVGFSEEQIAELRRRIAATRWPSKELVDDRSQGVQLAVSQALARYWLDEYDFGRIEERLNELPQFVTQIDGVDIHFIHVRSEHANALPLIMTHGWPGSVIELLDTVGPLTDPKAHGGSADDAFHLVLPSLPGYGFSSEPVEVGWDLARTARAWAELMNRLGYTRYVAQGGDVGAGVTDAMARQEPEGLVGIHTNLLVPALGGTMATDTDEERAAAAQIATFQKSGTGYFIEMNNRPQTIGYALLRLADRARDLDGGPRHGRVLQDRRRVRRRQPFGEPHPRSHPGQHHAVLADRHRRLSRPVVLGGLRPRRPRCKSRALARGHDPVRLHDVPRGDLEDAPQLGRSQLPERHLLQRGRQGRTLRCVGGAGSLQPGVESHLQVAPVTPGSNHHNSGVIPRSATIVMRGEL